MVSAGVDGKGVMGVYFRITQVIKDPMGGEPRFEDKGTIATGGIGAKDTLTAWLVRQYGKVERGVVGGMFAAQTREDDVTFVAVAITFKEFSAHRALHNAEDGQ